MKKCVKNSINQRLDNFLRILKPLDESYKKTTRNDNDNGKVTVRIRQKENPTDESLQRFSNVRCQSVREGCLPQTTRTDLVCYHSRRFHRFVFLCLLFQPFYSTP